MTRKIVPNYLFTLSYGNRLVLPVYLIFGKRLLCFIDVVGVFRLSCPKGDKNHGSIHLEVFTRRRGHGSDPVVAVPASRGPVGLLQLGRLRLRLRLWLWLGRLLDESLVSNVLLRLLR
jgi:hypothetical protein